jgi:hypothetical protein
MQKDGAWGRRIILPPAMAGRMDHFRINVTKMPQGGMAK